MIVESIKSYSLFFEPQFREKVSYNVFFRELFKDIDGFYRFSRPFKNHRVNWIFLNTEDEDFVKNLLNKKIGKYTITGIKERTFPMPLPKDKIVTLRYITLSPIVLRGRGGRYITAKDISYFQNKIRKLTGAEKVFVDLKYYEKHKDRVVKIIKDIPNRKPFPATVIPFSVKGNRKVHEYIWYRGIGILPEWGFGFVELNF